jgi:hypothetical protein
MVMPLVCITARPLHDEAINLFPSRLAHDRRRGLCLLLVWGNLNHWFLSLLGSEFFNLGERHWPLIDHTAVGFSDEQPFAST